MDGDSRVVGDVLGGDTDAYAELVKRYQRDVWRAVSSMPLDFKTSEEVVHQAFVNAYLNLDSFDRSSEFGTWIRSIARNLARQELRSRSRQGRLLELYGERLDRQTEPEDGAVTDALRACRQKLPDRGAEMLDLRYRDALGFEEIARRLGKTVEAARQHLSRLRLLLRDCIQQRLAGS